jgi:hypothetical protein
MIHACGGASHGFFSGWKNVLGVGESQGLLSNADEHLEGFFV